MSIETVEQFYKSRALDLPESIRQELGHFNVFRRREIQNRRPGLVPSGRRDFYKIVLFSGHNLIQYPTGTVETRSNSLLFAPPLIPHTWKSLDDSPEGYLCVFTAAYLQKYGGLGGFQIFRPEAERILALSDEQTQEANRVFERMIRVLDSDYQAKYDLLRILILELVHEASVLLGDRDLEAPESAAAARVTSRFTELLERQFPLTAPDQGFLLRSPGDYANQLGVHVNYLNRCVHSVTGKTTSQLIADRVALEAQSLLTYTDWNVSEIGYSLGYSSPSHFIDFFRSRFGSTPKAYRLSRLV